jgi:hypothetical protein
MRKTLIFSLSVLSFLCIGSLWAAEPEASLPDFLAQIQTETAQPAVQESPVTGGEWLSASADADTIADVLAGINCCQDAARDCADRCRCGVLAFACTPTRQCSSTCSCAPCVSGSTE